MWHRPDSSRNSGKFRIPLSPYSIVRDILAALIHNHIRKTETISDLRSSAPLGARTLDPNIKSVVLYQLS